MRSLSLKRETLAELTSEELLGVVGATYPTKSHQVCNPVSLVLACDSPTPLCPNPAVPPVLPLVSALVCTV